ncbi:MAG: hypothetical protein JWP95_1009 [Actinotalea sp.]|nr:hypothetical protein [Actinotalea sp.]
MSQTAQGVLTLTAVLVVALLAMALGWRRRARRSAAVVGGVPSVPEAGDLGALLFGPVEATYVSTTTAGNWLDRIVAHGLGVRSAASVQVHPSGVLISRTGARDLFLPASSLRGVDRTGGIAGKVVGGEGLVVLSWESPGGPDLDTGLRVRHAADRPLLTDAVAALVAATPAPTDPADPAGPGASAGSADPTEENA